MERTMKLIEKVIEKLIVAGILYLIGRLCGLQFN